MSPAQFRAQTADDQAQMIAYEMFTETVTAYQYEWREVYRELTKDGKENSGFDQMRAHMGLGRVLSVGERVDAKLGLGNLGLGSRV